MCIEAVEMSTLSSPIGDRHLALDPNFCLIEAKCLPDLLSREVEDTVSGPILSESETRDMAYRGLHWFQS